MSLGTSSCITSKFEWFSSESSAYILLFHYSLTICDKSSLYKALILDMPIHMSFISFTVSHALINAIWWDEKLQCYDMKYAFLFLILLFHDVYWIDLFRSILYHVVISAINRILNRKQLLFPFFPFDFLDILTSTSYFQLIIKLFDSCYCLVAGVTWGLSK